MLDKLLHSVGPVAGLVLGLLLGLYVVSSDPFGRGCVTTRDTVMVSVRDTVSLPPDTVWVRTRPIIVHDTVFSSRVDSLIAQTANKDSLIRELTYPQTAQVRFHSTKDSLQVTGIVTADFFPLDRQLKVIVDIDSLSLPTVTQTITVNQIVEVASPEVVVYSILGGVIIGGAIVYTLH